MLFTCLVEGFVLFEFISIYGGKPAGLDGLLWEYYLFMYSHKMISFADPLLWVVGIVVGVFVTLAVINKGKLKSAITADLNKPVSEALGLKKPKRE